jgi:RNA polymerase sigma factor (sigma-70 family)
MKEMNEKKAGGMEPIPPALVAQAREGDPAAFTELYERTSAMIYRTIRSMVRDEDLVWDVQQDCYLRAWRGLDKLETDKAFLPWLRRIAVNAAAAALTQRVPMTFTDLAGEEDEREPEIPDLSVDAQPELALDRKETARLVRELLSSLPPEQQAVMGMRYYEDMPVKDIAALLNVSPSTVKTQLVRGRKRIEAGVRALEKQGVKLYGLSPIPFLLALLRRLEPAAQAEKKALAAVLSEAPATGSAAVTAMTAGQAFLHGLGSKLLAWAMVAVLLAGGGALAYNILGKGVVPRIGNERPTTSETASLSESEDPAAEETPDRSDAESLLTGICGDDLTWTFDPGTGALTILGSGDMYDYKDYDETIDEGGQAPWFDVREEIRSVMLPEGLTSIGSYAFLWCRPASVRIPAGVTSIGEGAFTGCILNAIALPDSVTHLGRGAFRDCSSLSFATLSNGLSELAEDTFQGCGCLTAAAIPENVASVGEGAFRDCSGLGGLVFSDPDCVLPDTLGEEFDFLTIYGHEGSTAERYAASKGIPFASLDDASNFRGQAGDALTWAFDLPTGSLTFTGNGDMYDYGGGVSAPWENLRGLVTSVSLPEGLTSIGDTAFRECAITSVEIPDSVASLGWEAFSRCALLTSLEIPEGVPSIKSYTFSGCAALTSVAVPGSVTSIGECAFSDCGALTGLAIPDGVRVIENSTFNCCSSLSAITIPEGVTSIGDSAFCGCSSLKTVVIPESVTTIAGEAFAGCSSLTSVTIPDGVSFLDYHVFALCSSLTSVAIPGSVAYIGQGAFGNCDSLNSVTISEGVVSIERNAFSGCSRLSSVWIPESVTAISDSAFAYCSGLTIRGAADSEAARFAETNGISFEEAQEGAGTGSAPSGDDALDLSTLSFEVGGEAGADLTWRCDPDAGVLLLEGSGDMFDFGDVFLPEEAERPLPPWYEYSARIKTLILPDGLTSIGDYAFSGLAVSSVRIPGTVTAIGVHAFSFCYALRSVEIPEGVTVLKASTFDSCSVLTSVTLPESLRSIGDSAFCYCTALPSIKLPGNLTTIGENAFMRCEMLTSAEIPESVTVIGQGAFDSCHSLTSVKIPVGVKEIAYSAFSGCIKMTSVTIPESVRSIGSYAFSSCWALPSVMIPNSVTSIDSNAFSSCPALVIRGAAGSVAEWYAHGEGIPFEALP